jgi:predicted PurR-regulated permease PerM
MLVAAFLFAFLFDVPIRYLCRRTRLTYLRATAIVYGIAFAILAVLFFGSFSRIFADIRLLAAAVKDALPAFIAQIQATGTGTGAGPALSSTTLPPLLAEAVNEGARIVANILGAPIAFFGGVVRAVAEIGFAVFLSLVILLNLYKARGSLEHWVPAGFKREVMLLLSWLDQIWQRYLAAEAIFALALGAFSIVWFWLLGAPFPIALSIVAALLSLIPIIGGLLSGLVVLVPCMLLGSSRLVDMSPVVFGVMMALVHSVLIQLTYNLIALPGMGKMVRLPFWLVLSGVALGLTLGNILLAFLVIPLFSTIRVVGRYVLSKIAQLEPFPGEEPPGADQVGFFGQMYSREEGSQGAPINKGGGGR